MTADTEFNPNQVHGEELFLAGRDKLAEGDTTQAGNLWRQAALLRPEDEQIWLALLDVVQTMEDRLVCLENITAINPKNKRAAQQLRQLRIANAAQPEPVSSTFPPVRARVSRWKESVVYIAKIVLFVAAMLILLGLGIMVGVILDFI